MKPIDYKVGATCSAGHIVAQILGKSSKAVVYTTRDNQLRWDYATNLEAKLRPVIRRFDRLMAAIALQVPRQNKKTAYHLLGKCLFILLESGDATEAGACFRPVEDIIAGSSSPSNARRAAAKAGHIRKVFLVHGRDNEVKETVARYLEKLRLEPIILHEQTDQGRTIIEKFESHSNVPFAVVLLTPDDRGGLAHEPQRNQKLRPRQNVIFEMGFFIGKLGRHRVHALHKAGLEIPSDYHGVIYTQLDAGEGWKLKLAREILAAGIPVDPKHVM